MREYDGLFIIDPAKEQNLKEITSGINEAIVKNNGTVNREEGWGKQRLAYPIRKNSEGIYYKLLFTIDPSTISALHHSYRLNADILRVMITGK